MEIKLNWEFIKAQLPAGWRELAIERGLVRPQPPQLHAKVTDIEQVLRLVLHRVGLETSLQTTTSTAAMAKEAIARAEGQEAAAGAKLLDLSPPALHYWERKLGSYLAELLARMLDPSDMFSPLRWSGYEIVLTDGTTVTRPGAEGTTARVLYALRLADVTVLSCQVTDKHGGESMRVFEVHPGQLWMGDRLYSNPLDIAWVVDAGADVLVRYNLGALPLYDARGCPFDVMGHVRLYREPEEMAEWPVEVRPADHAPIQGRLCAVRLPEEQAEKARERLRREYGTNVSPQSLKAAAWLMVFTTAPPERMTSRQALELYRLRWQVELEIKRDKSIGGLDKLPNFREDTIATWLYAKLLIQQIARKAVSPSVAFPPSPVDFDLLTGSQRNPREAAPRQATRRHRTLAGHDSRLPGHSRGPASHRTA
jgi:hypothetical protein